MLSLFWINHTDLEDTCLFLYCVAWCQAFCSARKTTCSPCECNCGNNHQEPSGSYRIYTVTQSQLGGWRTVRVVCGRVSVWQASLILCLAGLNRDWGLKDSHTVDSRQAAMHFQLMRLMGIPMCFEGHVQALALPVLLGLWKETVKESKWNQLAHSLQPSLTTNSYDVFTHILQGRFTGTGAIIWLPQCQWNDPEGYGWYPYS